MPPSRRQSHRYLADRQTERRERIRENPQFEEFVSAFETSIKQISLGVCSLCKRRVINSDLRNNDRCSSCRRTRGTSLFTAENDMDFGEIPDELKDLSLIEQILIARVHPVVCVFKIDGQQTGYSGHVLNFVQNVQQVSTVLPQELSELSSLLLVVNRQTPQGVVQFRVRASRIKAALQWLKRHNQYYRNIQIDQQRINRLPNDGSVINLLPRVNPDDDEREDERSNNLIEQSCFPNLPTIDTDRVISANLRRLAQTQVQRERELEIEWPELDEQPLNEFSTEVLLCKAFPCLFPYGRGDINAPRARPISLHQYFKYLMQFEDGRFAKDPRFPYYAFNSMMRRDAISQGNVYIRHRRLDTMTVEELREILSDPNNDVASQIMYYGANLRATKPYWGQRCSELTQMVRQVGTPHVFFTFSAADYLWPDLFRILCPHIRDPTSINDSDRRKLMHENPHIVAWFFNTRCERFMSEFMRKMFKITDYWYRFEWQHRGSPHIHGLLWLADGPDCTNLSQACDEMKQHVIDYFDTLVKASIESPAIEVPYNENPCRYRYTDVEESAKSLDLVKVLSTVQRHTRHGRHCLRRLRNSTREVCRFDFPKDLAETSSLQRDNGIWKFIPKRNDRLLQRYNPYVTQAWRGNTDFSPIVSPDAVLRYISKYASKGEIPSESYNEILRRLMIREPSDAPAPSLVRRLLINSTADRNFSAQEVQHLLHGWPLYHCSREFVVLSLKEDWQLLRASNNSIMNRYKVRESRLSNISLYLFAKCYKRSGTSHRRVTTDYVVRVIPYLKLGDDNIDEYYEYMCKLHVPWRGEFSANAFSGVTPQCRGWQELYFQHNLNPDEQSTFGDEMPEPDEIEFEDDDFDPFHVVRNPDMVASVMRPDSQGPEARLGHRLIDQSENWRTLENSELTADLITNFLRTSFRNAVPRDLSHGGNLIPIDQMSDAQRRVIELCRTQLNDPNHPIRRTIIQGKAGTGKSAIIKSMCSMLPPDSVAVLAPTGAAAMNIDGTTIHSFLRISITGKQIPLKGENLRSFQSSFRSIRFIIIDEYSMVGLRMLKKIDDRLREARGNQNLVFGGYFMYFFGDLRQLPPVKDTAIYMQPRDNESRLAINLLNSIQCKITLTVVHRQSADQSRFKQVLDQKAIRFN